MRKLILATASAIALGIAGATPIYAQNLNTGPGANPAPAQDQGTAAGAMQPGTPQAGDQTQQAPPAADTNINNPDMASTSQSGADMGRLPRADIQNVQQKLQQDGLYRGRIDGLVGPGTQQALRSYQQKNGLPVTGTLDQQTMASLNGSGAGMGSSTMPNAGNDMNTPPTSNSGATNPNPSPTPNTNQKY
jgi:peptidoglycan hydrolase-like protein with peptidoglycan-binding domain